MSASVCYGANEILVAYRRKDKQGNLVDEVRSEGFTPEVTLVRPDHQPEIIHKDVKPLGTFGEAIRFAYDWAQSITGRRTIVEAGGSPLIEKSRKGG